MPFTNAVGVTYDSGDYPAAMDAALDGGGLGRVRRAPVGVGTPRALPRDRRRQLHRGDERHPPRARGAPGTRGRHRRARGGDHEQRPGPRDELCPARRRLARRSVRAHTLRRQRHRSRLGRWRLALGALHAPRLHRHRRGGDGAHRTRPGGRRRCALQAAPEDITWREGEFHSEGGTEVRGAGATDGDGTTGGGGIGWRRQQRLGPAAGSDGSRAGASISLAEAAALAAGDEHLPARISVAPSKGSGTSPTGPVAIHTVPTSARSRSIPRRAGSASWPGPGSTTSAAPSTR